MQEDGCRYRCEQLLAYRRTLAEPPGWLAVRGAEGRIVNAKWRREATRVLPGTDGQIPVRREEQ